ncbi:MAG TPA: type I methionyl aminopeptidase [Candidatus Ruthenibacterium avium]|uniref:Methionine aminopeptidase n=1 Tax=Candidatus Ruthenibacterium avium TaxID=2838751 RepID=A0A9D2M3U3_9FIRM|nr:type I methionyl aminopeptidase [Candidatus Ruthenibacterium avium]
MIQIKTPKEIEAMREACRISAGALRAGGAAIRPGATTADVDKAIYDYIVSRGAKPNFKGLYGFPGSACISVNQELIHGIPSKKVVLREGDIVSIDTGAAVHGWNGDNAYTFACGSVDARAQKLLDVTKEALYRGIAAAVPGNRVGDIGAAVQQYVEENGFSVVRNYVGHGVGRELHEDPEVPNYGQPGRGPRLVSGMVIAIEPMVNEKSHVVKTLSDGWTVVTADGGLSAHFEHTIAITPNGPVILTQEP